MQMREELTAVLKRVGDQSPAKGAFRAMRAACRDYLTHVAGRHSFDQQEGFLIDLGKLRSVFGQQVALLGYLYDIDIEEQLAKTLPPVPDPEEA